MNRFKIDLRNKYVILKVQTVSGTTSDELTRLFRCESGSGVDPQSPGEVVRGHFVSNPAHGTVPQIINESDIERFATDGEVAAGGH